MANSSFDVWNISPGFIVNFNTFIVNSLVFGMTVSGVQFS